MKKLLVFAVAVIMTVSAKAQFGIVGGLTSTSSDYESAYNDLDAGNINQYHAGLTYKISLPLGFALQPSLLYNVKGTQLKNIENGQEFEAENKTSVLELPIELQWGIKIGFIRPYALAEPYVGYILKNEFEGKGALANQDLSKTEGNFEYGFGIGAGVELFSHLQVSVKYVWNLGDNYQELGNISGLSEKVENDKSNSVMASIAILF